MAYYNGYSSSFGGITNTFTYNKRLQPMIMSAASPAQTVFSLTYGCRSIFTCWLASRSPLHFTLPCRC